MVNVAHQKEHTDSQDTRTPDAVPTLAQHWANQTIILVSMVFIKLFQQVDFT